MRSTDRILCAAVVLLSFSQAQATVIRVPAYQPSIQAGIDIADNGDTVLVAAGMYHEHITFDGKAILLTSELGASRTTIDKLYDGVSIVIFAAGEGATSILDGFTIQNGNASKGGGIFCGANTSPVIRNCVIKDCLAREWGGGICMDHSASPRIYRSEILQNQARYGGGIHCEHTATPLIEANLISDNHAHEYGGGVYIFGAESSPRVLRNLIMSNRANYESGAFRIAGAAAVIDHNTIRGNTGGIRCEVGTRATISNNIVANTVGDGITGTGSGLVISHNDVWNSTGLDYNGCTPGEGCISVDPEFRDPGNQDYYLHTNSPCLGTGQDGSNIGAFGMGFGGLFVFHGDKRRGQAGTQIVVVFYVRNITDSTLTCDLTVSEALGWDVAPTFAEMTLNPDQVDSILVTVSIPDVITGTVNRFMATAVSKPDTSERGRTGMSVSVSPGTIRVPSEQPTIQAGIEASGPGDTVLVAPGTYYEHLDFNGRAVVVKSEKGPDSTTITKAQDGICLVAFVSGEDSSSVLDGFTITGAYLESGEGGAVRCRNSSPRILNSKIINNTSMLGAGIDCGDYSSPLISGNTVRGNIATLSGGGIRCFNHSSPTIIDSWIAENSARAYGGGVYSGGASSPILVSNTIIGNSAASYGGGLFFDGDSLILTGNLVVGNSAARGGGICLNNSSGSVSNNTLDGNSAKYGGGIYLYGNFSASIQNSIITNSTSGKGIRASVSGPNIAYCDVWNNHGGDYLGCFPGEGCVSADPLYCNTAGSNYHLFAYSPCAGSGPGGSDIGAFGVGCEEYLRVEVRPGSSQAGRAATDVIAKFYVQNLGNLADTYRVDVSGSPGWHIDPLHREIPLDPGQLDSVSFKVWIPDVPVDTTDRALVTVVSQTDPSVQDSTSLTVTRSVVSGSGQVTPGSDQAGYADSTVSVAYFVQNVDVAPDSYSLEISDTKGWSIEPLRYDLALDPGESYAVNFTVSIPYVALGAVDTLTLLAFSKTNPFARSSARLNVTCNAQVEQWDLTQGANLTGPSNFRVTAVFYLRNRGLAPDSCRLTVSDSLGWDIQPAEYQSILKPGEQDSVFFDIRIPGVSRGTKNKITCSALSLTNPYAADTASLLVTCKTCNFTITKISDVGRDEGRQIQIKWASYPADQDVVTHYTLFRRDDPSILASRESVEGVLLSAGYPPGDWYDIGTYPADPESLYYLAVGPTLKDSTISEGMYWSAFFIRAGTESPTYYFDTPVDSGYSLDNLPPPRPTGLFASHESVVTKLTWSTTTATDFDHYTVYRDTQKGFAPEQGNRLGCITDTSFVDSTAESGRTYYYLASATDSSGNESGPTNEAMGVRYTAGDANTDGVIDIGDTIYLLNYLFRGGPRPSPFEAGETNRARGIDLGDVLYLVNYLFRGGPRPYER
jgi:hypothetical protein